MRNLAQRSLRMLRRGPKQHTAAELVPAYEFVQQDVERNLHRYLGLEPAEIGLILIVGAWHGKEIPRILATYPRCRVVCLEPNPTDFAVLASQFEEEPRVECLQLAAAEVGGQLPFVLSTPVGTSSLLEPNPNDKRLTRTDVIHVPVVRLDSLAALGTTPIDCLWVDVQGTEDRVLAGAPETLKRTRALFLEVATAISPYVGGASFGMLLDVAAAQGFRLCSLGTDPVNGEGNAFWVRDASAE